MLKRKWKRVKAAVLAALLCVTLVVPAMQVQAATHSQSSCTTAHSATTFVSTTAEEAVSNMLKAANQYDGWYPACFNSYYGSGTITGPWCAWFIKKAATDAGIGHLFSTRAEDYDNVNWMFLKMTDPNGAYKAQGFVVTDTNTNYKNAYKDGNYIFQNAQAVTSSTFVPQAGDLVFVQSNSNSTSMDHVALVWKVEGNKVYIIDGNGGAADSGSGSSYLRRKVRGMSYNKYWPKNSTNTSYTISGYVRPNYASLGSGSGSDTGENAVNNLISSLISTAKGYEGWNRTSFVNAGCTGCPNSWCVWFLTHCATVVGANSVYSSSVNVSDFYYDMTHNYGATGYVYSDASVINQSYLEGATVVDKSSFTPQVGDIYFLCEGTEKMNHVGFVTGVLADGQVQCVAGNNGTAKEVQIREGSNYYYRPSDSRCPIVAYIRPNYGALFSGNTDAIVSEFPLENNKIYKIRSYASGKVIDVPSGSSEDTTEIFIYEENGYQWQNWKAVQYEDGYSFVSVYTGKALTLTNSTQNGLALTQATPTGADNQRFKLVAGENGQYFIYPVSSNYVLDVRGGSTENATIIQQSTYHGGANQQWSFDEVDVEKPVIHNVYYTDVSPTGYTIVCKTTDNVGVSRVCFPTWTDYNGQDDLDANWFNNELGTLISENTYSYRVDTSKHNNEAGYYITQIYSYDEAGNFSYDDTTCHLEVPRTVPFTDVVWGSWYYNYVADVYQNGYMVGSGNGTFKPDGLLTRSEIVTTLYSVNGKPNAAFVDRFSDVPNGQWYSTPVSWAYRNSIVSGYADGRFGTTDLITREQFALMLYQYASNYNYTTDYNAAALSGYTDAGQVSSWADTAVKWAVSNGIISGKAGGLLDPKGNATRAECATMIMKLKQLAN